MTEKSNKTTNPNKIQKILIEVNTSGESSKFGIHNFESLNKLITECSSYSNIKVKGLMTMAPFTSDEYVIRKSFAELREMKEKLNNEWNNISELSMGMTNDFELAVDEGSTMVRVGTALFGERQR